MGQFIAAENRGANVAAESPESVPENFGLSANI
jgi:hypothetical protein